MHSREDAYKYFIQGCDFDRKVLLLYVQLLLCFFLFIFLKLEALLWLSRAVEICSFLDYYNKVLYMVGLSYCYVWFPCFATRKGRRDLSVNKL